ncbi:hypothetical protein [Methylosinus sp. LW4]|uniref:hypothetical protein n=1 Tax=Methylosinus sp. LW4 TaxID=136993 RepID=UPI00036F8084|nr:hypothetical protein [Methylosinus sp. LW4]
MTQKLTLCLVGPRGGGKSAALATFTDCIVQNAHGYPAELRPAAQSITRAAFHGLDSEASRLDILDAGADEYQRLRRDFAEGGAPTDATRLHEYFFRMTLNGEASPPLAERMPALVRIIDAAGAASIADETAPPEAPRELRDDFVKRLAEADAIILVLPMTRFEDSGWVGNLARLVERLAFAADCRAKRVVVAFSHYERLFVRLGPSAFTYACDPAVALHVLRGALRASSWSDGLRALEASGRTAVRFTVFSAHGFVKGFQNPNIDPHIRGDQRFRRAGVDGRRGFNEFWRPFLTADPFLYAALDLENAFMFSFAQIDASTLAGRSPSIRNSTPSS